MASVFVLCVNFLFQNWSVYVWSGLWNIDTIETSIHASFLSKTAFKNSGLPKGRPKDLIPCKLRVVALKTADDTELLIQ